MPATQERRIRTRGQGKVNWDFPRHIWEGAPLKYLSNCSIRSAALSSIVVQIGGSGRYQNEKKGVGTAGHIIKKRKRPWNQAVGLLKSPSCRFVSEATLCWSHPIVINFNCHKFHPSRKVSSLLLKCSRCFRQHAP